MKNIITNAGTFKIADDGTFKGFCPTGEGGGVDNSCGRGGGSGGSGGGSESVDGVHAEAEDALDDEMGAWAEETSEIMARGIKPASSREEAESKSREGAEIINAKRAERHTVYGSTYNGVVREGGDEKSVDFAGIAFGSGESAKALKQGAAILRQAGYKATVVDSHRVRGVVFS